MNKIQKLYYTFTCYLPRNLPTNEQEYDCMKNVMLNAYGLKDEPQTWATVAGYVTSTPATSLRRSWGSIANAAKRLDINSVASKDRQKALRALEEKLMKELEKKAQEIENESKKEDDKEESQKDQEFTKNLEKGFCEKACSEEGQKETFQRSESY